MRAVARVQERAHQVDEFTIAEASNKMVEPDDCAEHRHHPGVTEAKGRGIQPVRYT
jgi:hypothetical protein